MKDIEIIDIDYSATDPLYKKEDDVEIAKISGPFIVPEEGPIYQDSVRVIGNSGLDLIPGTDFECVEPVTDLTQVTGKAVHLYVELKDHIVASGGKVKLIYQRVGKPVISVKTLLKMLEEMVIEGKSIDWETQVTGKPLTYPPAWHSHDIQNSKELVGFGGLVELFSRLTWEHKESGEKMKELIEELQTKVYDRLNYIQKLKWGAIMAHIRNYKNPHGVVPANVDAGNIANNATATPQQDLEGTRTDLYSTPKGFRQAIENAEPVSEEYIAQNELPFGYYGSGIYLPPPITGSFEGLGGDVENSAFCLEGNGWLVGLIRAYDGRVKNLYYVYNMDFRDTNQTRSPWLNTYAKYDHPVTGPEPTDPNAPPKKNINFIISGSNDSVIMVGSQDSGTGMVDNPDKWWIGVSNSTFDPNSHTLKPLNMAAIMAACPQKNLTPGHTTVSHVGDWVYLLVGQDSFEGDSLAPGTDYLNSPSNYQVRMFRVPYKDLLDTSKLTINFVPVNVTFDNADRLHRTNQVAFFPAQIKRPTGGDPYEITGTVVNFTAKVRNAYLNRKLQFFIVPNPNNTRMAKMKVLCMPYQIYYDPVLEASRGFQANVMMSYDWDVAANTMSLDSHWIKPTYDSLTGNVVNPTQVHNDYIESGYWAWHASRFANVAGSWVPGFGFVSMGSSQAGVPPFTFALSRINRGDDPAQDYDHFSNLPINWSDSAGVFNSRQAIFRMRSPFGVAGFPRHYSQLYAMTDGVRQWPIEIFSAENEDQRQQTFYRITEGGADDNYIYRDSLKSKYIPTQIRGRKTNSSFGVVKGLNYNVGYVNRPRRANATSRGTGLISWKRLKVHTNPGAPYEFGQTTNYDGNVVASVQEPDGSLLVNLDVDYTLDPVARTIYCKANKLKQVRLPRSFWVDMVMQALGSHANELIDIATSFFINREPGNNADQATSMWQCTYHVKSSPSRTRMIIGTFTWDVASTGGDGIRVLRPVGMSYPFNAKATGLEGNLLRPGSADNTVVNGHHAVNADGSWGYVELNSGLEVKAQNIQILDFDAEGPKAREQIWGPGVRIATPGNASSMRVCYRFRSGAVAEASVMWVSGQAFNAEYNNIVFANKDYGWMYGVAPQISGGAMDLLYPWSGTYRDQPTPGDFYVMNGATYVEGNWSIFINADVLVTFNGYSMTAKMTNWDLRDLTDVYRSQIFYIYCFANGSVAEYEITKILRHHNSNGILVATVRTNELGIFSITHRQSFTISGFPLTRLPDMGVPVSSGALTEQGTYRFLKRTDLYQN
ncbi:putative virion structural protein [Pseudomonas phage OBP]|uniref:putative virion structural protein n=1 Tax=Pseudomonas phage OBP TaxID=1124849 RepID=UPI000240D565|nr:putative virion structural protein [Pseudomonas phage OBP]AEV89581.1 putative virion structural protein [Pseudomonas phage OBP]